MTSGPEVSSKEVIDTSPYSSQAERHDRHNHIDPSISVCHDVTFTVAHQSTCSRLNLSCFLGKLVIKLKTFYFKPCQTFICE